MAMKLTFSLTSLLCGFFALLVFVTELLMLIKLHLLSHLAMVQSYISVFNFGVPLGVITAIMLNSTN